MPITKKRTARNPLTGRPITVGGLTWKRLLRDGVLKTPGYDEPDSTFIVEDDDFEEALPPPLPMERQTAHATHFTEDDGGTTASASVSEEDEAYIEQPPTPVRKTRKYRGKGMKPVAAQHMIADCAVRGIKNNFDSITEFKQECGDEFTADDDAQLNALIQQMIVDEMAAYDPAAEDEQYTLDE